jgi:hypothetical protein
MDWKRIAQEAWDAPSWREAAREYQRDRPSGEEIAVTSDDPWIRRHQKERYRRLLQLERVLLGIGVHGPSTMQEPDNAKFVQWAKVHWQHAYRQIMAAQQEGWLRLEREARAKPPAHAAGCACWDCVLRLHGGVARHQAEMKVRREGKDEAF